MSEKECDCVKDQSQEPGVTAGVIEGNETE